MLLYALLLFKLPSVLFVFFLAHTCMLYEVLGVSPVIVVSFAVPSVELNSAQDEPPLVEYHHLLAVVEAVALIFTLEAVIFEVASVTVGAARSIFVIVPLFPFPKAAHRN